MFTALVVRVPGGVLCLLVYCFWGFVAGGFLVEVRSWGLDAPSCLSCGVVWLWVMSVLPGYLVEVRVAVA